MGLTLEQLLRIMPNARGLAAIYVDPLNKAMQEFGIDTPRRVAAFLSQLAVESGSLRYMEEIASGAAYDTRSDLGNTKPEAIAIAAAHGTTPGRFWKGHGPLQTTGFDNHCLCGDALGLDLKNSPRLLTLAIPGMRSAGWFWKTHGINRYADADDIDGVSDMVNRGRKTAAIGDANGYPERAAFYKRTKGVLGC